MPWAMVACAAVSAYGAAANARASAYAGMSPREAPEPDLEQLAREHRARMEAETAKTLRDAKIGTILLLAFVVTALYGLAQLAGFV